MDQGPRSLGADLGTNHGFHADGHAILMDSREGPAFMEEKEFSLHPGEMVKLPKAILREKDVRKG